MLDGFGLAPVTLQIDLDSYDGPWTHVHRFRGRSGWLIVAEARLTSGTRSWRTTIVAACDEYGEAVPGFMAPNLLACACSLPQPCHEQPPDELDAILEEEEGSLVTRWLRSTNTELAALHDTNASRIEALEARTRARVRTGERQIDELRRRRRFTDIGDRDRDVFDVVIAGIEAEDEVAMARLAARRAQWRAEAEAAEERLLVTTKVEVEVTPIYHVHWHACVESGGVQDIVDLLSADSGWASRGLDLRLPEHTGCPSVLDASESARRLSAQRRSRGMDAEITRLNIQAAALRRRLESGPVLRRDRQALQHQAKSVQTALDKARSRREQLRVQDSE